jgi:hypothetical protein
LHFHLLLTLLFSHFLFFSHRLSFSFWIPALFSSEAIPLLCTICPIVLSQILVPVFPYTGCSMLLFFKWRDSSQHLSHAFLLSVLHFIRNNLFPTVCAELLSSYFFVGMIYSLAY